jgi:hypothetical protein
VQPLDRSLLASDWTDTNESGIEPQAYLISCSPKSGCRLVQAPGT